MLASLGPQLHALVTPEGDWPCAKHPNVPGTTQSSTQLVAACTQLRSIHFKSNLTKVCGAAGAANGQLLPRHALLYGVMVEECT